MKKLILIDGNSLINRAFYATPVLTDKAGRPTNAVYAFTNMLVKMITEMKPDRILVAFDRHEPTFRHLMYGEYKGTRKPMPEELRPQIPMLKDLLKVMGIATFECPGIEADDIIGTMAKKGEYEAYIITGDKDSFQLVDKNTAVYFTRRGISDVEIYNSENFSEKTGITPPQIIDLKALMGDSSDNIPGITGVGEKTALGLLKTYGTVDNLYAHVGELKGKLKENVENSKDVSMLSKTLATIKTDVDIPLKDEDLAFNFPFSEEVKEAFVGLDFRNLIKKDELFSASMPVSDKTTVETRVISQGDDVINEIINEPVLTLAIDKNVSVYFKNVEYVFTIKEAFFDEGFTLIEALNALAPFFSDEKKHVICFSYKALKTFLSDVGITLSASYDDVDILRYLADFSGKEETLKEVISYYGLNAETPAYSLNVLYEKFLKQIKEEKVDKLYYDVELPLADVLYDMERAGFKVDAEALQTVGDGYKKELADLTEKIYAAAGETFNINSPKQLSVVLFEKLKIGKGKKLKSGRYSTGAEALEELADAHPVVPLILRYRRISKLSSTYVDGFKPLIDKKTGLVHTCFNQTLTSTGRLSSKEPNMQNIPVRDEEGRELRKLFTARSDDNVLIDADYSQIELRLLAAFSGCKELINAYHSGEDIHALTAARVFKVPLDEVTPALRRKAKAVNFGIIYGISEYGLAKNVKCTPKEAAEYIKKYFATYPEVKEYMDKNVELARKNGYVATIFNRRRYIKEINSQNYNLRSFGERAAMNMPLQGSSADIIKIAMVNVYNRLKAEGFKARLIMQVHDELIIDAPAGEAEAVKKLLAYEMENAVKLSVPLTVEAKEGRTWYDAK